MHAPPPYIRSTFTKMQLHINMNTHAKQLQICLSFYLYLTFFCQFLKSLGREGSSYDVETKDSLLHRIDFYQRTYKKRFDAWIFYAAKKTFYVFLKADAEPLNNLTLLPSLHYSHYFNRPLPTSPGPSFSLSDRQLIKLMSTNSTICMDIFIYVHNAL